MKKILGIVILSFLFTCTIFAKNAVALEPVYDKDGVLIGNNVIYDDDSKEFMKLNPIDLEIAEKLDFISDVTKDVLGFDEEVNVNIPSGDNVSVTDDVPSWVGDVPLGTGSVLYIKVFNRNFYNVYSISLRSDTKISVRAKENSSMTKHIYVFENIGNPVLVDCHDGGYGNFRFERDSEIDGAWSIIGSYKDRYGSQSSSIWTNSPSIGSSIASLMDNGDFVNYPDKDGVVPKVEYTYDDDIVKKEIDEGLVDVDTVKQSYIYARVVGGHISIDNWDDFINKLKAAGLDGAFGNIVNPNLNIYQDIDKTDFLSDETDDDNWFIKLLKSIAKFLKSLVVPDDVGEVSYLQYNFTKLNDDFSRKFGYKDYTDSLKSLSAVGSADDLSSISAYVNLSIWDKHLPTLQGFVRGVYWVMMMIFNIKMIQSLIRGTSPVGGGKNDN